MADSLWNVNNSIYSYLDTEFDSQGFYGSDGRHPKLKFFSGYPRYEEEDFYVPAVSLYPMGGSEESFELGLRQAVVYDFSIEIFVAHETAAWNLVDILRRKLSKSNIDLYDYSTTPVVTGRVDLFEFYARRLYLDPHNSRFNNHYLITFKAKILE